MEDWKEVCLANEKLSEKYKQVLIEGPKSLTQAWFLSAMKQKYQIPGSTNK